MTALEKQKARCGKQKGDFWPQAQALPVRGVACTRLKDAAEAHRDKKRCKGGSGDKKAKSKGRAKRRAARKRDR